MTNLEIEQLLETKTIDAHQRVGTVDFMNADCMNFLRWCKENMLYKHWHLAIVDPPYGIDITNQNMGRYKDAADHYIDGGDWDGEVPSQEYFDLLSYVSRNIILWGGNYFTDKIAWAGRCFVVWDKMLSYQAFAHGELALTTFDENAKIIQYARGRLQQQDEGRRHRTQKPVYVYDYLHLNFAKRGQRILDTHGGSFSHAIAAIRNGNELTIMDKSKPYYDGGVEAATASLLKPRLLF